MICFKNLIFDTAPLPVLRKRAQERGRGRGGVGEPMTFHSASARRSLHETSSALFAQKGGALSKR